jgi:hypothetical protein
MQLASLLEKARTATPADRIQWRDQIAPFGTEAINAIEPWLTDQVLGAFAVRVIVRVGEKGEPEAAAKALRSARTRVPDTIRADVDWALTTLKAAAKQAVESEAAPAQAAKPARARTVRERPHLAPPTARRSGRSGR